MNHFFKISLLLVSLNVGFVAQADHHKTVLFTKVVAPILEAKCVACHGEKKQKGKLRLDSIEAILKGGSEGETVVPGKAGESSLIGRVGLPLDDDEHMPPEDKQQLTKEEAAVVTFWINSGAKPTATIEQLKPTAEVDAAIKVVLANPPKGEVGGDAVTTIDPAQLKIAEEAMVAVEKTGASLLLIAQNTAGYRFSALNVASDYGDKYLETLTPIAERLLWVDLASTQVTDEGLRQLSGMKNLKRLHLEKTGVTDAGLSHLVGLTNLEYLNLYGTGVTDAGIAKLSGLKNLKKLFVWQTKVTDGGAQKIAAVVPGLEVNNGWKEPIAAAKPVVVAKNTNTPAKPAPKPSSTPVPAAPAPAPVAAPLEVSSLDTAIKELKRAVAETQKRSEDAAQTAKNLTAAAKKSADGASAAKAAAEKAAAIENEAKAALEAVEKLAKRSPGYEKTVAELKAAIAKSSQNAAAAKKKAVASAAASVTAAGKVEPAKAAATEAAALAGQTKAALEILVKATAE